MSDVAEVAPTRWVGGVEIPAPGRWEIDKNHTQLRFVARHMMVTKVHGRFADFDGALHVGRRPEDSWVEGTAKAASIDTGVADRDAHLRSPDFLDVENYPDIHLKSTSFEPTGDNRFRMTADLTIRGVTRPVVFEGEYGGTGTGMKGESRAYFTASGEIAREDWGLRWNVVLEGGGLLVGKRVQIDLEVAAYREA